MKEIMIVIFYLFCLAIVCLGWSQISIDKYRKSLKVANKYKVITLCGSTKFKDDFEREQKRLTLEGNIVLSVGLFSQYNGETLDKSMIQMLDDMHKKKIDMSDEIFIINKDGYIGDSTGSEIEYAKKKGIPVKYME